MKQHSNHMMQPDEVQKRLQQLVDDLRGGIQEIGDPKAQALCETSAEVLLGLKKAFADYAKQNEAAWR